MASVAKIALLGTTAFTKSIFQPCILPIYTQKTALFANAIHNLAELPEYVAEAANFVKTNL
jgi:hypothetical protein